jgi:hypothetical protein
VHKFYGSLVRLHLLVLLLSLLSACCWGAPEQSESVKIAQFSDAHFSGPHYNQKAMSAAVSALIKDSYSALVYTGDLGDNSRNPEQFYQHFPQDCRNFATMLKGFSGPLLFALGNDDFAHNYQTTPADLRMTLDALKQALGSRFYLDALGNGVSPQIVGEARWISINSLVFGTKNRCPEAPAQAEKTLRWLDSELHKAGSQSVVILTHLPPTWDLYSGQPSWKEEYIQAFHRLVAAYPGQVIVLAGHYHRNHIQALVCDEDRIPVLTCGALADKYGYASNWRELELIPAIQSKPKLHFSSVRYTVHYPEHPQWDSVYRVPIARMDEFWDQLNSNSALLRRYIQDVFGHDRSYIQKWTEDQLIEGLRNQFLVRSELTEPTEAKPAEP